MTSLNDGTIVPGIVKNSTDGTIVPGIVKNSTDGTITPNLIIDGAFKMSDHQKQFK